MRFTVGCDLGYRLEAPSTFVLNIEPALTERQRVIAESLRLTPEVPVERYTMPESGNRYLRLTAPEGDLRIAFEAEVELDVRRDDPGTVPEVVSRELPFSVLPHLYPSRYCQADRVQRTAESMIRGVPKGHHRITALCNWIHDEIEYRRGASDSSTSAPDTLVDRAGVCRDFAHLGITLCRSIGVPARFVSGYALGLVPPDFHAVFEAYLGGRWYLFDPTRQAALDGIVRIGVGRDAAEVAFCTIDGPAQATDMAVRIEAHDRGAREADRTLEAISLSDT